MKDKKTNPYKLTKLSYTLIFIICILLLFIAYKQNSYKKEFDLERLATKEAVKQKELALQKLANLETQIEEIKQKEIEEQIKKEELKKIEEAKQKELRKKEIPVSVKKANFLKMMIPALNKVYDEELKLFEDTKSLVETNPNDPSLQSLKDEYNAKTNLELLMALKPHPKSIALAQAAMESAWGESRFFKEANNLFGVWSFNKNEPRIAASSQRGENTIWLKKYENVENSIKDYYKQLSRSWAFKEFRELNYEKPNQNPYLLVEKLEKYSEKKEAYSKELASMIDFNKFTQYDYEHYERPKLKVTKKVETPLQNSLDEDNKQISETLKENDSIINTKEEQNLKPQIQEPIKEKIQTKQNESILQDAQEAPQQKEIN